MSRISSIALVAAVLGIAPGVARAQNGPQPFVRDVAGEIACGPQAALVAPGAGLRISGSADSGKTLFAIGDEVIISAGTAPGVTVGQQYFIRRVVRDRFTTPMSNGLPVTSIHTAGWLRIVDANGDVAIGRIAQACDGIETGDYLEPFVLPRVPPPLAAGEPDYSAPGHLILGDERRQMGGAGSLMVLDRGSDHGLRPGQRLTIYRRGLDGAGPVARIAEAMALIVHAETAMVRIESSTDAVYVGDLAAPHR